MLPRGDRAADKYEGFLLLHEGGRRDQGPNIDYRVPSEEEAFPVPIELFTRGWIHILEDTELAFILMMAACHHQAEEHEVRIRPQTRLLSYGIGHDAYEAHRILSRLGLMTVTPVIGREPSGKIRRYLIDRSTDELILMHTLRFRPDEFKRDALTRFRMLLESTPDNETR